MNELSDFDASYVLMRIICCKPWVFNNMLNRRSDYVQHWQHLSPVLSFAKIIVVREITRTGLSLILCFGTVSWPVSIKNKDGSFLFECEISFNFILFLNPQKLLLKTVLFNKRFRIEVKYFVDIIMFG